MNRSVRVTVAFPEKNVIFLKELAAYEAAPTVSELMRGILREYIDDWIDERPEEAAELIAFSGLDDGWRPT